MQRDREFFQRDRSIVHRCYYNDKIARDSKDIDIYDLIKLLKTHFKLSIMTTGSHDKHWFSLRIPLKDGKEKDMDLLREKVLDDFFCAANWWRVDTQIFPEIDSLLIVGFRNKALC